MQVPGIRTNLEALFYRKKLRRIKVINNNIIEEMASFKFIVAVFVLHRKRVSRISRHNSVRSLSTIVGGSLVRILEFI